MRSKLLIGLLLVAIGWNAALAVATVAPRAYFPTVANSQVATRLVVLVDTDAGFVTAAVIPGTLRVIVGYVDRHQGNRFFVGEHIGDTIKPIPDPALNAFAAKLLLSGAGDPNDPSFVFPGPKQGNGAIVFLGNEMRVYATSRREGDTNGPFPVTVLISNIPAPQ